jgi:phosphate uptake regulator
MLTQPGQTSLERELAELKREFLLMHNRTSKAVTLAFEALLEQNADKAKRAIASDTEIDEWQTMLEKSSPSTNCSPVMHDS